MACGKAVIKKAGNGPVCASQVDFIDTHAAFLSLSGVFRVFRMSSTGRLEWPILSEDSVRFLRIFSP